MYTLKALQLYAVTKAGSLKNERSFTIFNDFTENMNRLYNDGLLLTIHGVEKRYIGFLAFCLGDTPAMNWLGGFKETVGITKKYCRACEVSYKPKENESRKELFEKISLRTLDKHLVILQKMKTGSKESNTEISKTTGINYSSILLNIKDFDICQCLLQDPMHILYEGICHLELSCLFNDIISKKKIIKLDFLNSKIKAFSYFPADKKDMPNIIDSKCFKANNYAKFSQSSGQMSTLLQNLPLMIGQELFENENWNNFLRYSSFNLVILFQTCFDHYLAQFLLVLNFCVLFNHFFIMINSFLIFVSI